MRTISRHIPVELPRNDTESFCGYCGTVYHRSKLRRDRAGLLACERDYGGDVVTLGEAIAAAAAERRGVPGNADPGPFEVDPVDTPPVVHYPDGVPPISG